MSLLGQSIGGILAPQVSTPNLEQMLNVAPPSMVSAPQIRQARPITTNFSATNLPQFMTGRTEVSPGLFGPNQGLLGVAPVVAPQKYIDEYADLERQFQESFASRPEYYNRQYSVGQFIPNVPQLDVDPIAPDYGQLAAGATALATAKEFYPSIKDTFPKMETDIFDPIFEPAEDIADFVLKPAKIAVDEIQQIIPEGVGTSIQEVKDDLFDAISDTFGFEGNDTLGKLKETFSGVESAVGQIGDIENAITNPNSKTMSEALNAVESLQNIYEAPQILSQQDLAAFRDPFTGELGQLPEGYVMGPDGSVVVDKQALPSSIKNSLLTGASALDVINFARDPSVEQAPQAYASASTLSESFGGKALPGVEKIAPIASIYSGIKALEGGIESPGDVASVASGITGAASLASSLGVGGAGVQALGSLAGPIGLASLALQAPALLEGGAAGDFPRYEATIGLDNGNFAVTSEQAYDQGQGLYTGSQAVNALEFANYMVDNLGYEIDKEGYEKFKASDADTIVDEYGYFTERHGMKDPSHNAADFVANMLKYGAIKPTENTPLDFNINEAIQVLDPNISGYSPEQARQDVLGANVSSFLEELTGAGAAEVMRPERLLAGMAGLSTPGFSPVTAPTGIQAALGARSMLGLEDALANLDVSQFAPQLPQIDFSNLPNLRLPYFLA